MENGEWHLWNRSTDRNRYINTHLFDCDMTQRFRLTGGLTSRSRHYPMFGAIEWFSGAKQTFSDIWAMEMTNRCYRDIFRCLNFINAPVTLKDMLWFCVNYIILLDWAHSQSPKQFVKSDNYQFLEKWTPKKLTFFTSLRLYRWFPKICHIFQFLSSSKKK